MTMMNAVLQERTTTADERLAHKYLTTGRRLCDLNIIKRCRSRRHTRAFTAVERRGTGRAMTKFETKGVRDSEPRPRRRDLGRTRLSAPYERQMWMVYGARKTASTRCTHGRSRLRYSVARAPAENRARPSSVGHDIVVSYPILICTKAVVADCDLTCDRPHLLKKKKQRETCII